MTTITLTGLTRNNTLDHDLPSTINSPIGVCWFNGYWRIAEVLDDTVYALNTSFGIVSAENITSIPQGSQMRGLTKTATHLLVLFADSTNGHFVRMYDTNNDFVMQFTLTGFPSGLGLPQSICYDETNNRILVGSTGPSGGVGHIGAFTIPTIVAGTTPSTALISSASFDCTTGQQTVDAMVWYEGYAITIDVGDARFYVYKLSDQSFVSSINPTGVSPEVRGLGLKDGSLYLVDRADDAIDGWDIVSTLSVPDAPINLDGSEVSSEVVLTWDDPSDDTITDHAIFRKVGNGTYAELTTTALITGQTYTDDTAVAGTGYTYKIRAINATGNSADSNEFPFTTAVADTTAPTINSGVPLSANVTSTSVQWRVTFSEDVQNVDDYRFWNKTCRSSKL